MFNKIKITNSGFYKSIITIILYLNCFYKYFLTIDNSRVSCYNSKFVKMGRIMFLYFS